MARSAEHRPNPGKTEVKVYFLDECEYIDFVRRVLPTYSGFVKPDAVVNTCHPSTVCYTEEPPLPCTVMKKEHGERLQCPNEFSAQCSKTPVTDVSRSSQYTCKTEPLSPQMCQCRHVDLPIADPRFRAPRVKCARCRQVVYPLEELKILGRSWHKSCFRCTVCGRLLQLINYKEFEKLPYCSAHWPVQQPVYFDVIEDRPRTGRCGPQTDKITFTTSCPNEYANRDHKHLSNTQFYKESIGNEIHQRHPPTIRKSTNGFTPTKPLKVHDTCTSFLRSVEKLVEEDNPQAPWKVKRNAFMDQCCQSSEEQEEKTQKKGWFRRLGDAIRNGKSRQNSSTTTVEEFPSVTAKDNAMYRTKLYNSQNNTKRQ